MPIEPFSFSRLSIFPALVAALSVSFISNMACAKTAALDVLSIEPEPNYNPKKERDFRSHLTNNISAKSHMWVKSDALSWYQSPPIVIDVRVRDHLDGVGGVFSIHTADKPGVGVKAPRRIDIYSILDFDKLQHVGGKTIGPLAGNGDSMWLDVDLGGGSKDLRVVIHSAGRVISIDEIRLIQGGNLASSSGGDYVSDAVKDSYERLIDSVNPEEGVAERDDGINFRFFDFVTEGTIVTPSLIKLTSVGGQPTYLGVKIENPHKDGSCLDISAALPHTLYKIAEIYSVSGKSIPDPLIPVESCAEIDGGSVSRFLIKFSGDNKKNGELVSRISIANEKKELLSVPLVLRRIMFDAASSNDCLAVNVWTYSIDKPIWNKPVETLDYLRKSGVNVFTLAPWQLPVFPLEKTRAGYRGVDRFNEALRTFKDVDTLLLFAALDKKKTIFSSKAELRKSLDDWLEVVNSVLLAQERNYDDWLLYPVDEPRGDRMDTLLEIVELIDDIDPDVRIFANPLVSNELFGNYSKLYQLKRYIDIWQPEVQFVERIPAAIYLRDSAALWLYQNPQYPPKEESKLFYYALPLKAIQKKATGVGFWSATATNGSSAWTDIDGNRPDWSVLYESDTRPLSGLRWEAFQKGLLDACIYKHITSEKYDYSTLSIDEKVVMEEKIREIESSIKKELLD
jgi:hypothetical protein